MTARVTLPWPDKALSPNARGHWSKKSKATKSAREIAHLFARTCGVPQDPYAKRVDLRVTHIQPDNRHRDQDNMIASLKAYFDGLAQWMSVDDRIFHTTHEFPSERVKGGKIVIEIISIERGSNEAA